MPAARGDFGRERRVCRNQIERVGVEQFGYVERQDVVHDAYGALALTHAAADGERVHLVERQIVDGMQHQFGMGGS